jgi:hypothetical protein
MKRLILLILLCKKKKFKQNKKLFFNLKIQVKFKPCFADENDYRLFNHLTTGYSNLLKPVRNYDDVVKVSIDIRLARLIDIVSTFQVFTSRQDLT